MPTEAIDIIIDYLNVKDLQNLSQSCRKLRRAARIFHFGVNLPIWKDITSDLTVAPPLSNYRDGVLIDGKFYIVILAEIVPICWILDFTQNTIGWMQVPLLIMNREEYHPIRSTAGAAIKNDIYMFGGESRLTGKPTNIMYKLEIKTMKLFKVIVNGDSPTPRLMHSLDSVNSGHIILFGGRCMTHGNKLYDTKDFFIYSVYKNMWIKYDQTSSLPSPRSLHNSIAINGKLYIYGGQHNTLRSNSLKTSIHDDEDIWVFDSYKNTWHKYLAPNPSFLCLPKEWIPTTGIGPGKRRGASIFILRRRIIILGGSIECKNIGENEKTGEYMNIFCPLKKTWRHVKVDGMPRLECVAIRCRENGVFIIGKNRDAKIVMGWIID
ncbi:16719_t:CDS:2 [Dentiscutata erythropus]|uniref:16719_t:CDS:1 n=1 Tax=Dentiscutata erythropus TaxID=1348616 RepID=A0A9N9DGX5_9GLOM|nr:16719_t:CDS:2 [Dentiscutata erythropus]